MKFYPSIIEFLGFTPKFCEAIPQLTNEIFLKRIELGLSQREMAIIIDIHPSTLQELETNSRRFLRRTELKLFKVLQI
ncbi:MAG: hypothetical protein COA58_10830 [Bacteroidetes bacterium]|nr:MAG: hypothetical protein COA58_10830 [Bacteroidota bacterium]